MWWSGTETTTVWLGQGYLYNLGYYRVLVLVECKHSKYIYGVLIMYKYVCIQIQVVQYCTRRYSIVYEYIRRLRGSRRKLSARIPKTVNE